jgi:hypothetical protein
MVKETLPDLCPSLVLVVAASGFQVVEELRLFRRVQHRSPIQPAQQGHDLVKMLGSMAGPRVFRGSRAVVTGWAKPGKDSKDSRDTCRRGCRRTRASTSRRRRRRRRR